jgi:hypothetical protein
MSLRRALNQNLYYRWSKEFLEAGKKRLAGDTTREATTDEVKELRSEARHPPPELPRGWLVIRSTNRAHRFGRDDQILGCKSQDKLTPAVYAPQAWSRPMAQTAKRTNGRRCQKIAWMGTSKRA